MKKSMIFLSALMLYSIGYADQHLCLSEALSDETSQYFSATDYILLLPGFKAEPTGSHYVRIAINPYDATPPTTGIHGGPEPDDDGVVGAVKGSIDVSSFGAATYTIPIKLPTGLGGLAPTLFIYYSNQRRNGLLGWDWDLGGLSSITRTGGTFYHDGFNSAINYSDDRFCLDGQRLLKVSNGNYGAYGTVYHTEVDQMSKIVSYTESEFRGPSYFKVWTADGKICSYGTSQDSKALIDSDGQVTSWLLKSIEDRYGNVIRYHYLKRSDTYYVSRIEYSGNDKQEIETSFSVQFLYKSRNDSENSALGSFIQTKDLLLKNIIVYNKSTSMYTYSFDYREPDPQTGYPYNLLTSIGFKAGDQHVNPTKIIWSDNNYGIPSPNSSSVSVTTHSIPAAFAKAIKFSGDFNGDGYTDVIATRLDPNEDTYNKAYVFLNRGRSNELEFDLIKTFDLDPETNWIYVGDFDGDGLDDVLFTTRTPLIPNQIDLVRSSVYLTKENANGGLTFFCHPLPDMYISSNYLESLVIGDFYGEGKQSILVQTTEMNDKTKEESILICFNETSNTFQTTHFDEHLPAFQFYPGDYDGDGAIELLYKNESGYTNIAKLVQNNGTPHYEATYYGSPGHWDDCFPGDFNGDGIIDVLFYKSSQNQKWFIRLSTPLGFDKQEYYFSQSFPYQTLEEYHYSLHNPIETNHFISVGDFDGNGCADLILKEGYNNIHVYFGPINPNSENAPFANHRQINTSYFQYFSNIDLCIGNFLGEDKMTFLGNYSLSHLPSINRSHEVKTIKDGMGQITALEYDYLMPNPKNPSESDFYYLYSPYSSNSAKINYSAIPLRALKKVTTYNVSNKPVTTECHYEGALFHKQGKGFLGFTKTKQKEYCDNHLQKTTIRLYESQPYDPVIHLGMNQEEVFDPDGNLLAKTEYTNYLYLNTNNNRIYIPISYKYSYEFDIDQPERLIKKEISETTVETHCNQILEYDNILSIVQTNHGTTNNPQIHSATSCEYQTKTITTYMPDNLGQWLINRPKTVTRIDHREGNYEDICHQLVYSYNNAKPYQITMITAIPNNGSNPSDRLTKTTEFQYDNTGNLISKTINAPYDNIPSRTEAYTYSLEYGQRLMTEFTDAAGNTTQYKYDPVYNHCVSMIDCNHLETLYETDALGITTKCVFPDGTISNQAFRWDGNNYYQWEKKTGMPTKITFYAKTGDPIKKASYSLNGETVESRIEYDSEGRIKKEEIPHLEDQAPQTITYDYDNHNRARNIFHQDGTREMLTYHGMTTSSTFYSNGKASQSESKTVNIMGWVVKSTDADGTSIIYDYYPDGKMKRSQIEGMDETATAMGYDANGNRALFYDPNYGLSSCVYNIFGELTRQVSPKYDITDFEYDVTGNMIKRTESSKKSNLTSTTEWQYSQEDGKRGLLMKIKSKNQTISYEYDNKLRLITTTDQCLGKTFKTTYHYDQASRISSLTYPSGYTIHYCYSSEGVVRSIMDDDSNVLWKAESTNALGLPTRIITGDGLITHYDYDQITNKLLQIKTLRGDNILQNYTYEYDDFSNITARINMTQNRAEQFTYDHLNRLTNIVDNSGESTFTYDALGRMTDKTQSGQPVFSNASYGGERPHAIKAAIAPQGTFPQERMDLDYTPFGKVAQIQEGSKQITYQYGYDHQRIQVRENNDGAIREKIYANNHELITEPDGTVVKRTFLSSPSGIFAVVETINGRTSLHYIHKDHLGSWTLITDEEGQIEQECWFDAWGNCDDPDALLFDRGFTGHEHIKGMNLINMDGRVYDPVTSSMLSPDNYIQMPDFTQNYNRYAYGLNNPLSYSDPDGNNPIVFAVLAYFIFFTDMGYEFQKYVSPIAIHIDIHLASHQKGIGLDVSVGFEKNNPLSYRMHLGATYYWGYYDDSYTGWEFRVGGEWTVNGIVGYSGTTYYTKGKKQTTNSIILGNFMGSVKYENDYMFNIGKFIWGVPAADNGDRYRSAACRASILLFTAGFNIFTGDPGLKGKNRNTFNDPNANGRLTYTLNAEGNDPDQYRAGLLYFGIATFYYGINSEKIRHAIQNRFAHDWLCRGDSPYFKVLDRPTQRYFYFSSGTGNSLW